MARSPIRKVLDTLQRHRLGNERWARSKGVTIGAQCRIVSDIVTSEPWLVTLGDRVTISSNVELITHDGSGSLVRDERGRRYRYAPIRIGDDVFVGAGVIIMPGVEIGDRVVVGAGSVVTRSVPSDTVVAGIPARAITTWAEYTNRVSGWKAHDDMQGDTYRERVDSIAEGLLPMRTEARSSDR